MVRRDGARLLAVLAAVLVVLAGVSILKGGYYLGKHEGDTLHLLQMVLRMAEGEVPHLDFVTPIGLLAMAPIALFVKLGFGAGSAILWSQALVALVFLPAIWWVAMVRFSGVLSYLFGGLVLVLILALVHGEAQPAVSISMHYNRWAWAAAFLAIAPAVLPVRGRAHPAADGVLIGAMMAFLLLTKMTYFAAFFVPVLVALIARRQGKMIAVAVAVGLTIFAVVTIAVGTPIFWLAYLRDLMTVVGSDVRAAPGLSFVNVVNAPAYMGGSLALLASVVWLRQGGRMVEGMVMLLLVPAFFYVTYQNFGNDPQWLPLVGLMLLMLLPGQGVKNGFGWDMDMLLRNTAVLILAFGLPSVINLAYSSFRHAVEKPEKYTELLPALPAHNDIFAAKIRAHRVDGKVALDGLDTVFSAFYEEDFRQFDEVTWRGEILPNCTVELGTVAWFQVMADELQATGLTTGKTGFVADILNGYWLFGAFEPLKGNAPWYYGGLTGFEAADYLVVPLCPLSTSVRKQVLDEIQGVEASEDEDGNEVPGTPGVDVPLREVARGEMFILYEIGEEGA